MRQRLLRTVERRCRSASHIVLPLNHGTPSQPWSEKKPSKKTFEIAFGGLSSLLFFRLLKILLNTDLNS
jgi:hypothetical protein